jgi:NADH:ubiquinone oxidoreductase subunit 6 (subunit J)
MFTDTFFTAAAIAASLLVSLSTGIVYSFALLVMRGKRQAARRAVHFQLPGNRRDHPEK